MNQILKSIEEQIQSEGGKKSRSRAAVMEMFFRSRSHVTVDELARAVRSGFPGIGTVTVYRTLKLLARMGYAKELDFGDGARRYESNLSSHHDHLVCTVCGAVIEFKDPDIEKLQDLVTRRHGFHPAAHRLEIFGRCSRCAISGEEETKG